MMSLGIQGGNDPWETEADEHIHGVGTGDVADRGVSGLGSSRGSHTGESIWERGSDGHEGDGGDCLLESNGATENSGDFSDHGGDGTDEEEGDAESGPSTSPLHWRNQSEKQLPEHGNEMHHGLVEGHLGDNKVVLVNLGAEHAGRHELGAPGRLLLVHKVLDQLDVLLVILLLEFVVDDLDDAGVLLGDFHAGWLGLLNNKLELWSSDIIFIFLHIFVVILIIIGIILGIDSILMRDRQPAAGQIEQRDGNDLLALAGGELDGLIKWRVILVRDSVLQIELVLFAFDEGFSSNHTRDLAVSSVNSINSNIDLFVLSRTHDFSVGEHKFTWEIFIQNSDLALGIVALKSLLGLRVVKFDVEIVVWVPLIVIMDLDLDFPLGVLALHRDNIVDAIVVLADLG